MFATDPAQVCRPEHLLHPTPTQQNERRRVNQQFHEDRVRPGAKLPIRSQHHDQVLVLRYTFKTLPMG